jgi:hypothetical protein
MDHGDRTDASRLFNLMSDSPSPGFEIKETKVDGCNLRSKKFQSADQRSMVYCQSDSCGSTERSAGAYCMISTVSNPQKLPSVPSGRVTSLKPSANHGGVSPLHIPKYKTFRNEELGLEFTNLLGEAQWEQAHSLCANKEGRWRLPLHSELVKLAQQSIPSLPESVFGKKQVSYLSVAETQNGGPVYVRLAPTVLSHINVAFDEKVAVICVRK